MEEINKKVNIPDNVKENAATSLAASLPNSENIQSTNNSVVNIQDNVNEGQPINLSFDKLGENTNELKFTSSSPQLSDTESEAKLLDGKLDYKDYNLTLEDRDGDFADVNKNTPGLSGSEFEPELKNDINYKSNLDDQVRSNDFGLNNDISFSSGLAEQNREENSFYAHDGKVKDPVHKNAERAVEVPQKKGRISDFLSDDINDLLNTSKVFRNIDNYSDYLADEYTRIKEGIAYYFNDATPQQKMLLATKLAKTTFDSYSMMGKQLPNNKRDEDGTAVDKIIGKLKMPQTLIDAVKRGEKIANDILYFLGGGSNDEPWVNESAGTGDNLQHYSKDMLERYYVGDGGYRGPENACYDGENVSYDAYKEYSVKLPKENRDGTIIDTPIADSADSGPYNRSKDSIAEIDITKGVYNNFAGFEIGCDSFWDVRIEPYHPYKGCANYALEADDTYTPELPKYKVMDINGGYKTYSFGEYPPVIDYNLDFGVSTADQIPLANGVASFPTGWDYNINLSMTFIDDIYKSLYKYFAKYFHTIYDPKLNAVVPYQECAFEITITIYRASGDLRDASSDNIVKRAINMQYALICVPVGYANSTVEGTSSIQEDMVRVNFSVIGMKEIKNKNGNIAPKNRIVNSDWAKTGWADVMFASDFYDEAKYEEDGEAKIYSPSTTQIDRDLSSN